MTHTESFYLLKLNPPPRSIRIRNKYYKKDVAWECHASEICRIQINFLQTGQIHEFRENEQSVFTAGTVYTTLMGDRLRQELHDPAQELSMWLFLREPPLRLSAAETASRNIAIHEAIVPGLVQDSATARQIGDLLLAATMEAPRGDPLRSLKFRTAMYSVLTLLTQCSIDQARRQLQLQLQDWSRQTKRATAYIQDHLREKMTVEEIARAVGDNYDHLKTLFRRDVGMTLVEYINDQRIRKVRELLAVSGISSEDAGEAVGIQDPKYLGRLFRRYVGMTISEYRKLCREEQEL